MGVFGLIATNDWFKADTRDTGLANILKATEPRTCGYGD